MTLPRQLGSEEAIQEWDSDHTALVHVLWAAQRKGLMDKPDELASFIRSSRWMEAVHLHAAEGNPTRRYPWMEK